jgi:hypothetical protein
MKADDSLWFILFTMQKNELAEKIRLSIEDSSIPLWFPKLTPHLAETGWQSLKNELGLNPSNYGTARVLTNNIDTSISVLPFGNIPFSIELLPKDLTDKYTDSQIDFYNAEDLSELPVLDCLAEAVELIKLVPSLSESVFKLVKSVHLIKLNDDNYDVSFSEPHIPFSIFISVPKNRIKADSLRVAEAIVHEAMHLQLSLIEKVVPLISSNEQKFYSPWKDEYRDSTGILHALYVFKVIDFFYGHLELKQYHSPIDLDFIKNRRGEILQQINGLKEFTKNYNLTDCGLLLVKSILCQKILCH